MKKIVFTLLILSVTFSLCYSQNNWINTNPMKFGLGIQSWTINDVYNGFRYEQVDDLNNSGSLQVASNNSFSYSRFPLVFENIGENVHFSGSTTGAWDLLGRLFGGFPSTGDSDTEALPLELLPLQLGFGGWVQDKIGIYAGANYAYSRIVLKDDDVPDEIVFGGNKRGFHGIVFYAMPTLLLKSTVMYNWVANSKRAAKGTAQSVDLEGYYSINEGSNFGFWAGLKIEGMKMNGPEGQATDDWANSGIDVNRTYTFPEISGSTIFFRAGIFVLMGGRD